MFPGCFQGFRLGMDGHRSYGERAIAVSLPLSVGSLGRVVPVAGEIVTEAIALALARLTPREKSKADHKPYPVSFCLNQLDAAEQVA